MNFFILLIAQELNYIFSEIHAITHLNTEDIFFKFSVTHKRR